MITRRAILHAPALLLAPAPPPALIAFGDSLADWPESYAVQLARHLGAPLDNRAIGGSILAGQADAWLSAPAGPAVAIVGYNDMRLIGHTQPYALARFRALLLALATWRAARGPLYLGTCLRMDPYDIEASAAGQRAYADAARDVAGQVAGVVLVELDGFDPSAAGAMLPDRIHPSPAGAGWLAARFAEAMASRVYLPAV